MKWFRYLLIILFGLYGSQVRPQDRMDVEEDEQCGKATNLMLEFRFEDAIKELRICYKHDLGNMEYLFKSGICRERMGQFSEAKKSYLKILHDDSSNVRARIRLARIYFKESNLNEALNQYAVLLINDSTNAYYYKQSAHIQLKMNHVNEAIAHYEKAHELNPDDIEVVSELSSLYFKLNLPSKSEKYLKIGLQLDSSNLALRQLQVKLQYQSKEYKKVISTIEYILENSSDTSVLYLKLMGVANLHLGKNRDAVNYLSMVLAKTDDSETIHYYLGNAYRNLEEYDKSIEHFEKAINSGISENISTYYSNLAVSYEQEENYVESIKAYQAAYKSSRNKILLYHLARNYDLYYKDKETALKYYERYLAENDSDNVEFMDYSEHRINELRNLMHFSIDSLE